MQELHATKMECAEEGKVSYEIQWIIPNWRQIRQDIYLVNNKKAVFETGQQSTEMIQTKWLVGLRDVISDYDRIRARNYLQLLDIKGWGSQTKLEVKLCTQLCFPNGSFYRKDERTGNLRLYETLEAKSEYLDVGPDVSNVDDYLYISANGAIQYNLILTFKIPDLGSPQLKKIKFEQFSKRSRDQLCENLATLLKEDSDGDLKIVTSDGVELSAHRNILKAQCPVFARMLNSDLSETKTGIVKVEDLSGKTMSILLQYFYTGDLLAGWNDRETIVEFTYAAGKYQISQILELLDDLVGRGAHEEVSNLDVQLLNLAGKLTLKNAEKRLLQRVIGKVSAAKSSEELFQLFGYDDEEISRKAETLAAEQIGSSKVLDVLDYIVGNTNKQVDFSGRGFNLLALVQIDGSCKGLEKVLLKQIAETVSKFTTAEEILKFFGGSE